LKKLARTDKKAESEPIAKGHFSTPIMPEDRQNGKPSLAHQWLQEEVPSENLAKESKDHRNIEHTRSRLK